MQPITVQRADLIEKVKANRAAHAAACEEADAAYLAAAAGWFRDELVRVERDGKRPHRNMPVHLPEPTSHVDDYDTALSMLGWAIGDTIKLSQEDFTQFVLDQWAWSGRWESTMSSYSSPAGR